jgi:glycine cleavage system aminomethyltransferase T
MSPPVSDFIATEARLGAHNYEPLGVILSRGEGVWVWDTQGNRYLDCLSAYSAVNQGHCHPKILAAMVEQAGKLTLTSRAFYNDQLAPFYEQIAELTGSHRVLPMNSGAEAVESAIKSVRKWGYEVKGVPDGLAEIIVCADNFHGRTLGIVGFSTDAAAREHFGPFAPGFRIIPFGNAKALEEAITPNTVAFLVEPIQGEAGVIIPPSDYFTRVRELCTAHDVMLILDEIQTGLGRTGKLLAEQHDGIEADVTLIHEGPDHFYLVTGAGFGVRDSGWVAEHLGEGVVIREVTDSMATLNLCGPKAREILQSVSDDALSNEAFPFLSARRIDVADASALAVRIGYVGELGYELYIPQECAAGVYQALWDAGQPYGIANAGYRAIDSARLEKGYLYWSGDISPDYNPYEAGLGFCVALGKGDFIGRAALLTAKSEGVTRKLCSFTVEGYAPCHGGEAILHEGEVVSSTTSAGYGHTLRKTIAFGYLPAALAGETSFSIEAFGQGYPATRGPRCLYDPKMERLRA